MPISVIEKEKIVRYRGLNNVPGDVTLDISQFYICMTIKYNENYDGFNNYVEYSLYKLKRIGYDYSDIKKFIDNVINYIIPICKMMSD